MLGGGFLLPSHRQQAALKLYFTLKENTVNHATCPTCDAQITPPSGAVVHELISCQDCGTDLEILSLSPLTIDLAPEVEEDWGE